MGLQEKLDAHKDRFTAKAKKSMVEGMRRAAEALEQSGIRDRVSRAGQRAPDFELPDAGGRNHRLADALRRGPVVLSFYRGHW